MEQREKECGGVQRVTIFGQILHSEQINHTLLQGKKRERERFGVTQNNHEDHTHTHTEQVPLPLQFDSHAFG